MMCNWTKHLVRAVWLLGTEEPPKSDKGLQKRIQRPLPENRKLL